MPACGTGMAWHAGRTVLYLRPFLGQCTEMAADRFGGAMPKNIVICSDGTGNTAIKGRGTNVFKLFEGTALVGHRRHPNLDPQVALSDDGVGTENFRPLKIFAGMTGYGLSR